MAGSHLSDTAESFNPDREIKNLRSKANAYPEPVRSEVLEITDRCEKELQDAKIASETTAGDKWENIRAYFAVSETVMLCINEAKAVFDRPESEFLLLKARAAKLTGPNAAQIKEDVALCENVIGSRQTDAVKRGCLSSLARLIIEAETGGVILTPPPTTPQPAGTPTGPGPTPAAPSALPVIAGVGVVGLIAAIASGVFR
jgi:hypothetical protein